MLGVVAWAISVVKAPVPADSSGGNEAAHAGPGADPDVIEGDTGVATNAGRADAAASKNEAFAAEIARELEAHRLSEAENIYDDGEDNSEDGAEDSGAAVFSAALMDPQGELDRHLQRLTSGDWSEAAHDIEAIWRIALDIGQQDDAIAALWPLTSHSDPEVRQMASQAIESLTKSTQPAESRPDTPPLSSPESEARIAALGQQANAGETPLARSQAIAELSTVPSSRSVDIIEAALMSETDAAVQLQAVAALGSIAEMEVDSDRIRQILQLVADSGPEEVAAAAEVAIAEIDSGL